MTQITRIIHLLCTIAICRPIPAICAIRGFIKHIPEKYAESLPRQGGIRQQCVLVGTYLLQYGGHLVGSDVVDIHEAQSRERGDMLLALATGETCRHAEAGHTMFVVLGGGHIVHVAIVTVFLCEVTHRLIGAHQCYQRIEGDALGKRVGKTFE